MKRAALAGLALAALMAAAAGGYWAGLTDVGAPDPGIGGPIIYYMDPDGRPVYASEPRRTADGRPFRAVHASEDVSFADKPATGPGPASLANGRILYYRNPMGLPDISPVPKKDSMGMDYIPVYEGEEGDGKVVRISPGRLQRTGVRSELAQRRSLGRLVHVPGTVQLDERRVSVVAMRSDAFVDQVANVTTGDRVTRGQPLFQAYAPEIAAAGAQFLADLNSAGRRRTFGGARQQLENLGVPSEAIAEIERTREVPLSMTWRAPRDGVVLERNIVEGMKIAAGDVVFRLANLSMIWVVADVPEFNLESIRIGAPATIRVRSLAGQSFTGHIALIYPQVGETTRTTRVRIEIPNPTGALLPNMYAEVEIGTGSPDPVIAVPNSAVIDSGTRQVVILDLGEGRFEPRPVQIGIRGDSFTEIRDGIAEGDRVVVAANFLIDAESNLKAALRSLEAQP